MTQEKLMRVVSRLQNLPSISLPTDYPRPAAGVNRLVEAEISADLPEQTCSALVKLALYDDEDEDADNEKEEEDSAKRRPSAFHIMLAAFSVLLHRYTGDTDIIIGSSSASATTSARDPLVLRLSVNPTDSFWTVVRKVQQVEEEAEADVVPYEAIVRALGKGVDISNDNDETTVDASVPLFRVRFFDETDAPQGTFMRSTSLTSDLTVFVSRQPDQLPPQSHSQAHVHPSTRSSLAPHIALRILYNSLLFTPARITSILDQLSVLLRRVSAQPRVFIGVLPLGTPAQRSILPDPTADLHWCDFKGAITDVFSRNARRWPDRTCVVQCVDTEGGSRQEQERRTFSYASIWRASNILAHHLIQRGVQREEVVMVYAYRSVELVVAVMAILKAGATFSVIGACLFHISASSRSS